MVNLTNITPKNYLEMQFLIIAIAFNINGESVYSTQLFKTNFLQTNSDETLLENEQRILREICLT